MPLANLLAQKLWFTRNNCTNERSGVREAAASFHNALLNQLALTGLPDGLFSRHRRCLYWLCAMNPWHV